MKKGSSSLSKQTGSKKTRIILADSSILIRQALKVLLEKQQDLEIIAEAGDGKEVIQTTNKLHPDVIVMETDLPQVDGFVATKHISRTCPDTRVLLLSPKYDVEHIARLQDTGAGGYLPKNVPVEVIIHAIRTIVAGEIMSPVPGDVRQDDIRNHDHQAPRKSDTLSQKELTILRLVARGMSNKNIALHLELNLRYIKASLTTIFMKLHVSSRTEAISVGLKNGILTVNDFHQ